MEHHGAAGKNSIFFDGTFAERCHAAEDPPHGKRAAASGNASCFHFQVLCSPKRVHRFFPFLLMILDTKREQLLPQQPLQYNADILQKALDSFVQAIIDYGRCPKSIAVCDERTEAILSELCHKCGILLLKTTRFCHAGRGEGIFSGGYGSRKTGRRCRVGKK